MSINLSIRFQHPDAVSQQVRYARIDNVASPVYVNVTPNPITSPATIATDIPNGQYKICTKPVYSDGRTCNETCVDTDACPGLISINAYISDDILVISYLAPSEVPKVRFTVNYPNGGSFTANYVNDGNDIGIAIPSQTGIYTVTGQSVCDEDSAFYSPPSSTVSVERTTNNLTITSSGAGITITDIINVAGFTLDSFITAGSTVVGTHDAFFNSIGATFSGTPAMDLNMTVYVNNVAVSCADVPNTAGGSVSVGSISVGATDQLLISFGLGTCP